MSKNDSRQYLFDGIPEDADMSTYLVHGKPVNDRWDFAHHIVPPMSASVTYRLDSAERGATGFMDFTSAAAHKHEPIFIYDRLDEPTRSMLEENLARAEGGDCCTAYTSGMAAISAAIGVCVHAGDHILCHQAVYGCTYSLLTLWLERFGIRADFVDFRDEAALRAAIKPNTRVLYTESPVNPTLEVIDIGMLRRLADDNNKDRGEEDRPTRIIIDNTFATPYGQRPLSLGADIVCHSLTKNIGGFGTDMGGAVIARAELEGDFLVWRKDFGGAMASRVAWTMLVYGLPTLPLRLQKQCESALEVAKWLEAHPKIARVVYPGLESFEGREIAMKQMVTPEGEFLPGSLIYFETKEKSKGDNDNARHLVNDIAKHAYSITLAVSLGQLRTLIECPGVMTHSALPPEQQEKGDIAPNGVRLSLGIESPKDIIQDLEKSLQKLG